jgi:hypothetical protein
LVGAQDATAKIDNFTFAPARLTVRLLDHRGAVSHRYGGCSVKR